MNGKYDDIINLPHHVSTTRPRMPMSDRAAQFSSFKALSGYGDAVEETARLTTERIELAEDARAALEEKISYLSNILPDSPTVEITYFQPDKRKSGGAYVTATGTVKRIDDVERTVIMRDGVKIRIADMIAVDFRLHQNR